VSGVQCAFVSGHSREHLFSTRDETDAIRLRHAQDTRDREIAAQADRILQLERVADAAARTCMAEQGVEEHEAFTALFETLAAAGYKVIP
jgi:hypothetical protein